MSSANFPLQNKGIYRNLPTFDPEIKDLVAIVTGANGMSGFHTMRVLLESPARWKKVYALSRRPPPEEMMDLLTQDQRDRVEHVALDFLKEPEEIAEGLKAQNVVADVAFFYSYAQPRPEPGQRMWSNAQQLVDVNSALFRNFLAALTLASITPHRIVLQTGAKNYGVHLGPGRTPYIESDPRVTLEPSFYYAQEDLLFEHCAKSNGKVTWNVICPAWIIGAVDSAAMNSMHPLATYAAVEAHKGAKKLAYPGDVSAWLGDSKYSSAMLTGYLSEWAALEDKCENQKFNASDCSPLPMNRLWPELARWYGVSEAGLPEVDESKLTTVDSGDKPTPLGFGPPTKIRFSFTLAQWASEKENHDIWREIMAKHKITHDPFDDIEAYFPYGDAIASMPSLALSMNKARYFGWSGFVDTLESLFSALGELSKIHMLPPMIVDSAKPSI